MDKPAQPAEPWLGEDGFLSPFIPPPSPPDLGSVRPERRGARAARLSGCQAGRQAGGPRSDAAQSSGTWAPVCTHHQEYTCLPALMISSDCNDPL